MIGSVILFELANGMTNCFRPTEQFLSRAARQERLVLHVGRNPSTGVWAMMKQLTAAQNRAGDWPAAMVILADKQWGPQYRQELPTISLPFFFRSVPTLFGTGAYLSYLLSNPLRRMMREIHNVVPSARFVLHFHTAWMTGCLVPVGRGYPIGAVATFHGVADRERLLRLRVLGAAHRFMARRLLAHRVTLTAVSEQTTRDAEEVLGMPADRFRIVANGIPGSEYLAKKPRRTSGEFVVGHVGQLHHGKGWHMLVEAVEDLRKNGRDIRLIIAGAGMDEELVKQTAARCGAFLDFRGFVPDAGRTLIPDLDALVLASWTEGMPMSVVEAFAAGVPVVATRAGGLAEMIEDGISGLTIERTPSAIASAICKLMDDAQLRGHISAGARAAFEERYEIGKIVRAYEALYASALVESSGEV